MKELHRFINLINTSTIFFGWKAKGEHLFQSRYFQIVHHQFITFWLFSPPSSSCSRWLAWGPSCSASTRWRTASARLGSTRPTTRTSGGKSATGPALWRSSRRRRKRKEETEGRGRGFSTPLWRLRWSSIWLIGKRSLSAAAACWRCVYFLQLFHLGRCFYIRTLCLGARSPERPLTSHTVISLSRVVFCVSWINVGTWFYISNVRWAPPTSRDESCASTQRPDNLVGQWRRALEGTENDLLMPEV